MCINPITRPSRQDDLFPGTTQSVASIDVFIVFLVDVPENKKRRFKVRRHDLDRFKVSGPTNEESSRLYPL